MRSRLIRLDCATGRVMAGGVMYADTHLVLLYAADEWRECARSVVRSAQKDRDPIYRLMGARAARYRLAVSKALQKRAADIVT